MDELYNYIHSESFKFDEMIKKINKLIFPINFNEKNCFFAIKIETNWWEK